MPKKLIFTKSAIQAAKRVLDLVQEVAQILAWAHVRTAVQAVVKAVARPIVQEDVKAVARPIALGDVKRHQQVHHLVVRVVLHHVQHHQVALVVVTVPVLNVPEPVSHIVIYRAQMAVVLLAVVLAKVIVLVVLHIAALVAVIFVVLHVQRLAIIVVLTHVSQVLVNVFIRGRAPYAVMGAAYGAKREAARVGRIGLWTIARATKTTRPTSVWHCHRRRRGWSGI